MGVYFAALNDLFRRYAVVWKHHWAHRRQMDAPRRRPHELQFLPAALALQETPVSPRPLIVMGMIILFAIIALLWACLGKIDIVASATGKIVPGERVKIIQPLEAATVTVIHVAEGQHVRAGDALIDLDTTVSHADAERLQKSIADARLQILRAEAMLISLNSAVDAGDVAPVKIPDQPDISPERTEREQALLNSEWLEYQTRQAQAQALHTARDAARRSVVENIHRLALSLNITRQRERDYARLNTLSYVSRHEYLDSQQKRIEQEGELASLKEQQLQLASELEEISRQQASLRAETLKKMQEMRREGRQQAEQMQQELVKARQQSQQRHLVSPVAGTVQQLALHTIGGVVTPAQALMTIVPEDNPLEVEAYIENKDIGFVYAGQEAEVKIETFPYTKYGTLHAQVTEVSADAVTDEKKGLIYTSHAKLQNSSLRVENKTVHLTSGMAVTLEIKTGKRRVIEYFLSPLLAHQNESLRER